MPRIIRLAGWIGLAMTTVAAGQPNRPDAPSRVFGGQVLDGLKVQRDIPYVTDGHSRQVLDLYVPQDADKPLPLLIWIHGGGWQAGSKDGCPPLRKGYAQRGYAVASINYRLSDHATFPAQIEDCKAAIRWLRAHAKENHLDPDRFGVWGSSAGGHLVALVGTSGDVKEFDVGEHLGQSSRVQAVCDYYGPTDFEVFVTTPGYASHAAPGSPESKLLGGVVAENLDKATRANSVTYVSKDDPPFLIVHGDQDGTVPINQSQLLFDALKAAGRDVHFHTIHGAGHGGPGFTTPQIESMVQEFFDKHLRSTSSEASVAKAETSESTAPEGSARRPSATSAVNRRGRIPFERVLSRNDRDHDGTISRAEFPASPTLFERLDANGDGFVTREEHEQLPPRP